MAINALSEFGENIWTAEGPPVSFYGMPYPVRMTVIKLKNGDLFIHSPIAPDEELIKQVQALGRVKFLVSPNKIHHLYIGDWQKLFGQAKMYASPGLRKKRADLEFDADLQDKPELGWAQEIDQLIFDGSRVLREVVFFHHQSKTLILTDLIENFDPDWFGGWKNIMARLAGIVAPDGRAPIDYRLSFFGHKRQARKSVERMKLWQPENIIIAHGACYKDNGMAEMTRAFRWVE